MQQSQLQPQPPPPPLQTAGHMDKQSLDPLLSNKALTPLILPLGLGA